MYSSRIRRRNSENKKPICYISYIIFSISEINNHILQKLKTNIYYFQWKCWQRTIQIYEVFDCKIFKGFSLHCSLLLAMIISLNYFAIYIFQKTNPCIYSFTFYL